MGVNDYFVVKHAAEGSNKFYITAFVNAILVPLIMLSSIMTMLDDHSIGYAIYYIFSSVGILILDAKSIKEVFR